MTKSKKIIFAVAALVVIIMLFIPPFYGKGDDGSFYNVLLENGLYNQEGADTSFFSSVYGVSQNAESKFFPITLAKVLCGFVSTTIFDIRVLGVLYLPIYLAGLYLILRGIHIKNAVAETAVSVVAAIMLCDVGYFSYLNSLYTDAIYLCTFILMAGSALNIKNEKSLNVSCVVLFMISAGILAFFGAEGLIAGVLSGVMIFAAAFKGKGVKAESIVCGVLTVLISAGLFIAAPANTGSETQLYGRVIDGALYKTQAPEEDLKGIGLDSKYASFSGISYYDALKEDGALNPAFKEELQKVSRGDVLMFYIKNPSRFINVLSDAGKNAPFLTQSYIKTQSNTNYSIKKAPAIWSFCRRFLTPASFWIILAIAAVAMVWSVMKFGKNFKMSLAGVLLAVSSITFFIGAILRSGLMGISRNLLLHQCAFDIMLVLIVTEAINIALSKRQELRDKFGVNQ